MSVVLQTKTQKVLIVDDEKNVIESVKFILEDIEGIDLETASDGIEAISKLKEYLPSLVILDGDMPKANGSVVVREMKNNKRLKNIKILGFTGSIEEKGNFERLGVDKVILKYSSESDMDNFQNEVRGLLETEHRKG